MNQGVLTYFIILNPKQQVFIVLPVVDLIDEPVRDVQSDEVSDRDDVDVCWGALLCHFFQRSLWKQDQHHDFIVVLGLEDTQINHVEVVTLLRNVAVDWNDLPCDKPMNNTKISSTWSTGDATVTGSITWC